MNCGFGIRVHVGGADAFVGGGDLTSNSLVAAARSATAAARGLAKITTREMVWAPVPVVRGEWIAPIEIDPFAVSIDEHIFAAHGGSGMHDGLLMRSPPEIRPAGYPTDWFAETRVFASSEGSLVTQSLVSCEGSRRSSNWNWRNALSQDGPIEASVEGDYPRTIGFEALLRSDRFERLQAAMEEVARFASLPCHVAEIGRHDVLFSGAMHGSLLSEVLVSQLSLDRVLGNVMDVAGGSWLAPPSSVLGQQVLPPLLSCRVMPEAPAFGASAWDDEGVATTPLPLVGRGVVKNYLSSRTTLPMLADQVPSALIPKSVPGVTHVARIDAPPAEVPRAVAVSPAAESASLNDLAKHLGDGILVKSGFISVDSNGLGGVIAPRLACEVKKGAIVSRIVAIDHMGFSTKRLLTTLSAIGDASTVETSGTHLWSPGIPWHFVLQTVSAPAAVYHKVDVVPRTLPTV